MTKPNSMAANDFTNIVKTHAQPQCARQFQELTREFVRLRYQISSNTPEQLTAFKQQTKRFNRQYR